MRAAVLIAALTSIGCGPRPSAIEVPPRYRVIARLDVDGDGRPEALVEDPEDCGGSGCRYELLKQGPGGVTSVFAARAFECGIEAESDAGHRRIGCIRLAGTNRTRALEHHRWTGRAYEGDLDHLNDARREVRCRRAEVRTPAPVWLLPAHAVRVSRMRADGSGWELGPPETPRVGLLGVGEVFEPSGDVTDRKGVRWLERAGIAPPLRGEPTPGVTIGGWVEASRVECSD